MRYAERNGTFVTTTCTTICTEKIDWSIFQTERNETICCTLLSSALVLFPVIDSPQPHAFQSELDLSLYYTLIEFILDSFQYTIALLKVPP